MKTEHLMNGGLRFYVSILPALFPAIVLFAVSMTPLNLRFPSRSIQMNPTVARVKEIYTSQIGVREKQPNSGAQVEKYQKYVNLPKGNPWCAAFVCWVYGRAGVGNPKSGWSPELFPRSRVIWSKGKATLSNYGHTQTSDFRPQTSDIFGLYFPEKGRIAHVGFIDHWDGTWLVSVEGNTNVSGSREGDGVYRKRRLVRSVYKVARYICQEPN